MSGGFMLAALAMAAVGYSGRYLLRNRHLLQKVMVSLPKPALDQYFSKYERGGFAQKMTRSEAAKILGVPATARIEKIREAHKRVMIANHPGF
jgi:DnaJ family protein C protein 19